MIYYITIIDTKTHRQSNLVRNDENIAETVEKELGSYSDKCMTSNRFKEEPKDGFIQSGLTTNKSKVFSIICLPEPTEEI